MITVDGLMEKAFGGIRDPRSDEYKAGVRAALEFRVNAVKISLPYSVASAQADAFFAGTNEGHRIFRELSHPEGE